MDLTFTRHYQVTVQEHTRVVDTAADYQVTKVQRSKAGFKTPTETLRRCERCRELDHQRSGTGPFPIATWLLTADAWTYYGFHVVNLGLCSDHFKELRDESSKRIAMMSAESSGQDLEG